MMRTVITGASGFVGRQLVERLKAEGHELLLVGRDGVALQHLWPDVATCTYSDLPNLGAGFDQLIHLAVLNNDVEADEQSFFAINVDLALQTLRSARDAGIGRFLNISSMHALSENTDPYSRSKRAAAASLGAEAGIECVTVYLPAVYGDRWAGKLSALNRFPKPLANALFRILAALKPAVHVGRLAELCSRTTISSGTVFLADDQDDNPVYRLCKRLMDIGFAVVVLALLWWALIGLWVAIRLQSPGPSIFAQERVGRGARRFTCYKFRTMHIGTVQAGTHEVSQSAVTSLGSFLRRTKIDELPQVWNILRNEISLVGPRPCLPVQTELIAERLKRGVLDVTPGISGLAQINNIDMSEPVRLAEWDARYVATRSLLLDFKILLRTALGSGQGDKINSSGVPRR